MWINLQKKTTDFSIAFLPIVFNFIYAYFKLTDYSVILFFVVNTTAAKALTNNNEAYNATFIVSPVFGASFLVVVVVVVVVVPLFSAGFAGFVGVVGWAGVVGVTVGTGAFT